jgi:hypothetical protein
MSSIFEKEMDINMVVTKFEGSIISNTIESAIFEIF